LGVRPQAVEEGELEGEAGRVERGAVGHVDRGNAHASDHPLDVTRLLVVGVARQAPAEVLDRALGEDRDAVAAGLANQREEEGDIAVEQDGARVVIDGMSLLYVMGCEVDFVEDLTGSYFRVNNPNASSSCGCGNSFAV
jgi:hypothetical protein